MKIILLINLKNKMLKNQKMKIFLKDKLVQIIQ
jgi:hypothetical protein